MEWKISLEFVDKISWIGKHHLSLLAKSNEQLVFNSVKLEQWCNRHIFKGHGLRLFHQAEDKLLEILIVSSKTQIRAKPIMWPSNLELKCTIS